MNLFKFPAELRRRNVYKVAIAYAVIAWLLIQAGSILFPTFEAAGSVMKVFVTVIAAGFVLALFIAWAFEMTPQGMKRTEDISPDEFIPQWSKRKFATLIVSVAVIATGLLIFQLSRTLTSSTHPTMPEKSIAVLPFENLSRDRDNVYFTEGIQDEILTRLAKIADLKVISRTSTQRYKSSPEDLPQIAKRLEVANILEHSVQKTADRVRVTVQLLNAARDEGLAILKQLHDLGESSKQRYVSPFNLALVHIGLGQKDQAIQLLEQTYEERDGYNLAFLKIEPYLDPLRGDPRFEALVEKVFSPTQ